MLLWYSKYLEGAKEIDDCCENTHLPFQGELTLDRPNGPDRMWPSFRSERRPMPKSFLPARSAQRTEQCPVVLACIESRIRWEQTHTVESRHRWTKPGRDTEWGMEKFYKKLMRNQFQFTDSSQTATHHFAGPKVVANEKQIIVPRVLACANEPIDFLLENRSTRQKWIEEQEGGQSDQRWDDAKKTMQQVQRIVETPFLLAKGRNDHIDHDKTAAVECHVIGSKWNQSNSQPPRSLTRERRSCPLPDRCWPKADKSFVPDSEAHRRSAFWRHSTPGRRHRKGTCGRRWARTWKKLSSHARNADRHVPAVGVAICWRETVVWNFVARKSRAWPPWAGGVLAVFRVVIRRRLSVVWRNWKSRSKSPTDKCRSWRRTRTWPPADVWTDESSRFERCTHCRVRRWPACTATVPVLVWPDAQFRPPYMWTECRCPDGELWPSTFHSSGWPYRPKHCLPARDWRCSIEWPAYWIELFGQVDLALEIRAPADNICRSNRLGRPFRSECAATWECRRSNIQWIHPNRLKFLPQSRVPCDRTSPKLRALWREKTGKNVFHLKKSSPMKSMPVKLLTLECPRFLFAQSFHQPKHGSLTGGRHV